MLILDQQNLDLKRLINIQKCRSSTKVDHCALVAVLKLISPHLNLHDFSEKTKPFYCPSGANFSTKSKDLRLTARSVCSVNSSCWTTSNGCSARIFSTLMNKQFEVVIINLYSSEQKYNLSRFILPCAVCEYCKCVQPYKHVHIY